MKYMNSTGTSALNSAMDELSRIRFFPDRFFDRATLERGLAYAERGRGVVTKTIAGTDTLRILGTCRGSYRTEYKQDVKLSLADGVVQRVSGSCSCPVGDNCKHVVALLHAWRSEINQSHAGNDSGHGRQEPTPEALAWLHTLEQSTEPPANTGDQCILYVLSLPDFHLKLFKARLLKHGGYGRPEAIRPDFHRLTWGNVPTYYQPDDLPILRLFLAFQKTIMFSIEESLVLRGEEGAQLLRMTLRTGRLHLGEVTQPALGTGATLTAALAWQRDEQGRQRLVLDTDGNLSLLPTQPLWYLDSARHLAGELRLDLPEDMAAQLLAAPPLDDLDALLVRDRLRELGASRGLSLPLPEAAIPEENAGKPAAVVRLQAGRFRHTAAFSLTDELAVATLWFEYPGLPRVSGAETPPPLLHGQRAGRSVMLLRDVASERGVWQRLQAQGMESYRRRFPNYLRVDAVGDCLFTARQDVDSWVKFLDESVPVLEAAGIRVEIAEDFPFHLAEADDWFIEVLEDEVEGNGDWFDLDLGVVIDGLRTSLVEPLARLIAARPKILDELRPLGDDERVPLALDERRVLPVPVQRLRAWLGPLLEFAGDQERPRLSRLNAGALADLERLPGHWLGGERLREMGRRLRDFSGIAEALPAPGFKATLRPYQQTGLNWLQFLRSYGLAGILADDMGLGKTVQTLAHLHLEKSSGRADRPSLVILPTSLITNWRSEAQQFAPDLKMLTLHGPERAARFHEMAGADVILTTYPLLVRDQQALLAQDYHLLILDEAQFVKNPKAQSHRVARQLKARHRLSLTGTPLENHLGELWAQYHFLLPGLLGDVRRFATTFRTPIEKQGDNERRQQLAERVRPFLLRRTKEQVLTELPPKTEIIRWVELAGSQRDLYESLRLAFDKKLRQVLASRGVAQSQIMILDALLKLRQACCDPRLVKLHGAGHATRQHESAKLDLLLEMLTELLAEGRHVLLFSQFTSMLALIEEELARRGIDYLKLTGQTKDRDTPIRRFQAGEVPLFLVSLKAGGTGLNLTAADTVIHYDPWWNPAGEEQATARTHRIGQDKAVFVYKLLTQGTVEEKILALQDRKRGLADNLLAGVGTQQHLITATDLDVLFQPISST
ncbi:MAG: DEAD/DEAH box helicase [Sterolibacterium sp.]|jgi:superfamily II DNA or RNA helicase